MKLRTIWEGKIKLVEFVSGGERVVRFDVGGFDFDELKEAMKNLKREHGDGVAYFMLYALAGLLEEAKLRAIFLQEVIFSDEGDL